MKFALVNGQRIEAHPDLSGACIGCGEPMVAKCGEIRVRHWAHKGHRLCDAWWENETSWHRSWKEQFPTNWQEIVHTASDGQRHIADVKTDSGWVIEFQHSYLSPEERRSRNMFYPKLVWVLDGKRRKRDADQFLKALNRGLALGPVRRVSADGCAVLREWAGSNAPLFFDFGGPALWWLFARSADGSMYVGRYSRVDFIESHGGGKPQLTREFEAFIRDIPKLIGDCELSLRARHRI